MKIILIPGDGVGAELAAEIRKVLETIQAAGKPRFKIQQLDLGEEHFSATNVILPSTALKYCQSADLIWVGPLVEKSALEGYSAQRLLNELVQSLNLHFYQRRIKPVLAVGALKSDQPMDALILQDMFCCETVTGELPYHLTREEKIYIQTVYSSQSRLEALFEFTRGLIVEKGRHKLQLSLPDELLTSDSPWIQTAQAVFTDDLPVQTLTLRSLFFQFVHHPETIDLVVTLPPFGPILSRFGSALEGGLGLSFESYQGPDGPHLYHVLHPASRRFVGRDAANPIGAFLSLVEMLEQSGQPSLAKALRGVVEESLQAGWSTRDMGGSMGTVEIGDFICAKLMERLR